MGKGKSEVKVQMTGFLKGTPKESTFKVEVKPTPIGGYYEATIFRDGHKADALVRALKETAARDAAEEVITMANKNFSEGELPARQEIRGRENRGRRRADRRAVRRSRTA